MFNQYGPEKHKMPNWKDTKLFIVFLLLLSACDNAVRSDVSFNKQTSENLLKGKQFIAGEINGLNYSIITGDKKLNIDKQDIEILLSQIQALIDTKNKQSFIYRFNHNNQHIFSITDSTLFLTKCFQLADSINQKTYGYFDPTAHFLTKIWGFDKATINRVDSNLIQIKMKSVGFNNKHLLSYSISKDSTVKIFKKRNALNLDFSAFYHGIIADNICALLSQHNNHNYLIEVEGVRKVKGRNFDGLQWQIGIDIPKKSEFGNNALRDYTKIINLNHGAIATVGNYNVYYKAGNEKRSYTINPKTGFPVNHKLLCATVWAKTCAEAEAYAHAFMNMGLAKSIQFIKNNPKTDVQALLYYTDKNGELKNYKSKGMQRMLEK